MQLVLLRFGRSRHEQVAVVDASRRQTTFALSGMWSFENLSVQGQTVAIERVEKNDQAHPEPDIAPSQQVAAFLVWGRRIRCDLLAHLQ